MEVKDVIKTRKSIRAYNTDPVPKKVIEEIIETARWAPSWENTQPWELAVVCGEELQKLSEILIERISTRVPPNPDFPPQVTWPEIYHERRRENGKRLYKEHMGWSREESDAFMTNIFQYFGSPCALFVYIDEALEVFSIFDCALFVGNIVLMAENMGLGTCILAGGIFYPDEIRTFLKIPESKKIIISVALGYPDNNEKINALRTSRVDLASFVRWYGI